MLSFSPLCLSAIKASLDTRVAGNMQCRSIALMLEMSLSETKTCAMQTPSCAGGLPDYHIYHEVHWLMQAALCVSIRYRRKSLDTVLTSDIACSIGEGSHCVKQPRAGSVLVGIPRWGDHASAG